MPLAGDHLANAFGSGRLHLILLPTEKCNFRCTYCYEDFSIGQMPRPVIDGVKALLSRRAPQLTSLHLSWFGGEPLLALGVISEISAHAQELSRESAVSYSADVTTNAWLLSKERARRMLDVGVTEYQVSLDGERQEHDATRVRRNGAGSFDAIWANLSDLRETDWSFLVTLRLHLTPSNIASMIRLSRDLGRAFLGDPRFRLLLKPIERLGGPNDAHMAVLGLDSETAMGVVREAILADQPAARFAEPDAVCYAAKATSLVVRADGRIGKCTVALQDPTNTVGDLLPDGRLIIDQDRLRPWLRGWGSVDPEELACPLEGLLSSLGRPETAIRPELPVLQASS